MRRRMLGAFSTLPKTTKGKNNYEYALLAQSLIKIVCPSTKKNMDKSQAKSKEKEGQGFIKLSKKFILSK